jgi:flagellar FliL protein
MAEEKAAEEAGGKSKKKLIIFIVLGVLIGACGAGAGAFFFLGGPKEEVIVEVETIKKEAIYTKIRTLEGKPSFVATLQSTDGKSHYMQVYVEAKSRDQIVADTLTLHMPLIVARLNNLFATQSFDELMSIEGKHKLQDASNELVKGILQEKIGRPGIEQILFTNFVMQ